MDLERCAPAKPPRGSGRLAAKDRRNGRVAYEKAEKAKVRKRFSKCRWPHCRHKDQPLEVAHLIAKGHGGDPAGLRTRADKMVLVCHPHHLWDPQEGHPEGCLEHHQIRIEPLTDLGTFGPCAFFRERVFVKFDGTGMEQVWELVAKESKPGVLEP
jgi:hypothetical protein